MDVVSHPFALRRVWWVKLDLELRCGPFEAVEGQSGELVPDRHGECPAGLDCLVRGRRERGQANDRLHRVDGWEVRLLLGGSRGNRRDLVAEPG